VQCNSSLIQLYLLVASQIELGNSDQMHAGDPPVDRTVMRCTNRELSSCRIEGE
jgi:hypothetical protein